MTDRPGVVVFLALVALLSGCPQSTPTPEQGTEGGACLESGSCEAGLVCLDDVCLVPGGEGHPCDPNHSCDGDLVCFKSVCTLAGGDGQPCRPDGNCDEGLVCSEGECMDPECVDGGCVDDSGFEEWASLVLYRAPTAQFPDEDPFWYCEFIKVCYKLKGKSKLRGCTTVDFELFDGSVPPLPLDTKLSIVVKCYDGTTDLPEPQPIEPALSKGESALLSHAAGEAKEVVAVYMLPISSFGPTCSPQNAETQDGVVTTSFSGRWGATLTELFDGTVLIAGGIDDVIDGCDDWSDPACIVNPFATAEIYNPQDGSFQLVGTGQSALMTQNRAFAAAVRLPSGHVAVFGGLANGGEPTNTVEIYDALGFSFIQGPAMQETRAYHTATLISSLDNGYVLLVGGYGTGEGSWEVWRPDVGVIASGALHESRWRHTSTVITDDIDSSTNRQMVVIAGGEGGGQPGSATVRSTMEIFDIDQSMLDPQSYPLCSNGESGAKKTMHAAAYVPERHFIYMAGGFSDGKHLSPAKDICVWHSVQEKWLGEAGTFLLKKPRGGLTATALPGNVVLFAGGLTKSAGVLLTADTVEIVFEYLNKDGSTVVDIGPSAQFPIPMLYPRWDHNAIETSDGKVLFVGGLIGSPDWPAPADKTELFNPQ